MQISLIFGLFPDNIYNEIIKNSKGVIQYAADALQKSFLEGLGTIDSNITLINLPYIGSYPFLYKKIFSPKSVINYKTQYGSIVYGQNVGFLNFIGLKNIFRYRLVKKKLLHWIKQSEDPEKVVIVYAMHTPFLQACVDVKLHQAPDLKIVLIVPDLPEFMSDSKSTLYNILKNADIERLHKLCFNVDGFVLLSKHMSDRLPIEQKPFTIVEGIFNNVHDDVSVLHNSSEKYILYTGTLAKRYGVMNLVKAFHSIDIKNVYLYICGAGDSQDDIIAYTKVDHRIKYKGQLPRKDILLLQKNAFLLVNPRTPEGEFTKYSFPSKTMEYLASGTPTLIYALPGIPKEYFDYCFTVEKTGVENLAFKLKSILEMDEVYLRKLGLSARNFVLREKTPIPQCKKVIQLINSLY